MLRWLRALVVAWRDRRDRGLSIEATRFGTKSANGVYDYDKARAGYLKAQKQTETGRPIQKPRRRRAATVTPLRRAQ